MTTKLSPSRKKRTNKTKEPTRRGPTISRRRGLPTGRAVVGALLVTLAAIGLFVAYRQAVGEPDTHFYVLNEDIDPGQRIDADDVRLDAIELPQQIQGTVFDSAQSPVGAVAIVPLRTGELIQSGDVLLLAPGEDPDDPAWREYSFTIDATRAVDGQLRPGESVDLIATYKVLSEARTIVVFRDAPLLRVSDAEDSLLNGSDGVTLTVGLSDPDTVLAAVNAIDEAEELTVLRSTKADDQELPEAFEFNIPSPSQPVPVDETAETEVEGETEGG